MTRNSEGWTDDMTIEMPAGVTVDQIANIVVQSARARLNFEAIANQLVDAFGLTFEDAALATDRVHGGIVRASTRQADNCPNKAKDPFAWTSFQLATNDPSIIRDVYPKYWTEEDEKLSQIAVSTQKRWWEFWK